MTPATRPILTLLVVCLLSQGLAACGRKGPPVPPEGEEASYTYPGFYPNWDGTLAPRRGGEEEEATKEEQPARDPGRALRKPVAPTFTLEGDGYSRTQTRTY